MSTRFIETKAATKIGRRWEHNPNWALSACGCCAGIQWSSGTEPIECRDCGGGGTVFVHLATGTVAQWPGGPLNGGKRPNLTLVDDR